MIDLSTAQPIYPTTLSDNTKVPDPRCHQCHTQVQLLEIEIRLQGQIGVYLVHMIRLDNTFRGKIDFKYKVPGVDGLTLGTDINLTLLDRSEKLLENHI